MHGIIMSIKITNEHSMTTYCGYIALVGRPNVGKSTLLNRILDQKISITSRKPQTTRHSILGLRTDDQYQYVYVDTPGIHMGSKKAMNRMMNKTAIRVLNDVDVIVFISEGTLWQEEDDYVLKLIKEAKAPCVWVINKVDKIADKKSLLPWIEAVSQRHSFAAVIPLSARTGVQTDSLHGKLKEFLPESPHFFPEDQVTDRSLKFLCAEIVREKIFRTCGQELPYSTTVEIESYEDTPKLARISALIWVDKESHKRMIIGDKGEKLKDIATAARLDMEKLVEKKVFLQCWCKVKSGWSDNERILQAMGYE